MYNINRLYQSNILNLPKQHIYTAYQSNPLKPKRCSIHHPPGVHRSIATLRPFSLHLNFIPYAYINNCGMAYIVHCLSVRFFPSLVSSVRSSNSHPDLLVITSTTTTPLFQITPVLNTGLSLSELQRYKGYNAI